MFTFPTSTVSQLSASLSTQIADPGTLAIVILSIALPLTFWLIYKFKKVVPGGSGR